MKRFFSLALALCLTLSLVTISAIAAPTASGFTLKGQPGETLALTADLFEANLTDEATMESLTVTVVPDPGDGELRVGTDAVGANTPINWASLSGLAFHPATNFRGTASFTWKATDGTGDSGTAVTTLNYTVPAPEAYDQTVKVFVNSAVNGTLRASPTGVTFSIKTHPSKGSVSLNAVSGAFTYIPSKDFVGTDTFTFTATNGFETSNIGTVTLNVGNVLPPTASPSTFTVDYRGVVAGTLTGLDPNTPKQDLDFIKVSEPKKGSITSFVPETGYFEYRHNTEKLVSDTFTFRTSNGYRESETATVTININPPTPSSYQDMTTHWAGFSAGVLKKLDLAVGEKIQDLYYYNPSKPVTRAEFARFLNAVMKIEPSKNAISKFADVSEPYMVQTVNALFEQGITSGTQIGSRLYFYPNRYVTRIEAIRLMDNALKLSAQGTEDLTFADKHLIPSWGVQSVKNLVAYKMVTGNKGYLRPTDNITRAEVAQLMYLAYIERNK